MLVPVWIPRRRPGVRRPLGALGVLASVTLFCTQSALAQKSCIHAAALIPFEWRVLAAGRLGRLQAQAVLYRTADRSQCLVRVRITNVSPVPVAAAVDSDPLFVFLNQWSTSSEPRRLVIDEMELSAQGITKVEQDQLLELHRTGRLAAIPFNTSVDYWRRFSGQCPSDNRVPPRHYLILSFSGRVRLTDGTTVEELTLLGGRPETRDVAVRTPLRWATLPRGARRVPP